MNRCPMSNEQYRGACPVKRCPYVCKQSSDGCAYNALAGIEDIGGRVRAARRLLSADVEKSMEVLARMVDHLAEATDNAVPAHACAHCGHPECDDDTACDQRREIAGEVATVPAYIIWHAARNGRVAFLPRSLRAQVAPQTVAAE